MTSKALAAGRARPKPVITSPEPTQAVVAATALDPARSYRVRLSAVATYLGTSMSPMHLHVVTGTVAQAIRASIARFDPA